MKIARICSLNKNGTIHSAPVWCKVVDENIIFGTPINSKKGRKISRNNKISILIDNQEEQTKVVIIYGEAKVTLDYETEEVLEIFRRYVPDEENARMYWEGLKKIATWYILTVSPYKFGSFDYTKDETYRKAVRGEL